MQLLDALMTCSPPCGPGCWSSHDAELCLFQFAGAGSGCADLHAAGELQLCAVLRGHAQGAAAELMRDPEMRATIGVLVGSGLLVALLLWVKGVYGCWMRCVWACSTRFLWPRPRAFPTTDYRPGRFQTRYRFCCRVWLPVRSTGGGIKMVRMLILVNRPGAR